MLALPNLPESYYISIFTSGLKDELKSMVKIIKSITLAKAFEAAILQESTITAINRRIEPYKPFHRPSRLDPIPNQWKLSTNPTLSVKTIKKTN